MKVTFYQTAAMVNLLEVECHSYSINCGDFVYINAQMYRVKSKCYKPKFDLLEVELKESK